MKYLASNHLAIIVLSMLIVAIASFGVLSILAMNHEMGPTGNCSDFYDATTCINYHLGIMHNLSAATISNQSLSLISLIFFFLIGFLAASLFKILEFSYTRYRFRVRQLYKKTVTAFFLQLGHWLTLFEKRDPLFAFVKT